jgi:hypothetical protein
MSEREHRWVVAAGGRCGGRRLGLPGFGGFQSPTTLDVGRGRPWPGGGCRLWAERSGGDAAAGGVAEDIRWAVLAAGANSSSG